MLCLGGAAVARPRRPSAAGEARPAPPKPPPGPPPVYVFPVPGSHFASPATQITFRGLPAAQLGTITVTGSASGAHSGTVQGDSDGDGASFVPSAPFTAGETVTVTTSLNLDGSHNGTYQFQVATPAGPVAFAHRPAAPRVNGDVWLVPLAPRSDPGGGEDHQARPRIDPGDIFVAPQVGPLQQGPEIIGPNGGLIWFDPVPHGLRGHRLPGPDLPGAGRS